MRKRLKQKKHSCAMCKPHKMQWEGRWKPKDEQKLKLFEKMKARYMGTLRELST